MKKILLLSAALIAVLAGPTLAQDRRGGDRGDRGGQATQTQRGDGGGFRGGDRGGFRGGDRGGFQGGQRNFGQRDNAQAAPPAPQAQQAPQNFNRGGGNFAQRNGNFAQRNDGQRDFNRGGNNFGGQRDFNRGGNNNFRGNDNRPGFGGNNFGRNDRFDGRRDNGFGRNNFGNQRYSQYYRSFNADRRFRVGRYYGPSGYSYRRWSYGDFLPSLYWGSNYWLNNYYAYDLSPPFPGTVWVRYGDDALLIDRYTGEVIQVAYGIFW